jgi:hypothetical protein
MLIKPIGPHVCKNCEDKPRSKVMGDGHCEKHGGFAFYEKFMVRCRKCAQEKKMCQRCGKPVE